MRRTARRRIERQDDDRPPNRCPGPGDRLDRRLAGSHAELRSGRGRCPRCQPRLARRRHAGWPRRGPVDRRRPAQRSGGRSPGRRPTVHRECDPSAARHAPDRRSSPSPGCPGSSGREPSRPARTANHAVRSPDGGDRIGRPPTRARTAGLAEARPGCRRPAHRGGGCPQSVRPAWQAGRAADPLCRRRRTRRLPVA